MACRLVLDEHVNPFVAAVLREHGYDAVAMREWDGGRWLGSSDESLLRAALADDRTLVTYAVHTIPGKCSGPPADAATAGLPHGPRGATPAA